MKLKTKTIFYCSVLTSLLLLYSCSDDDNGHKDVDGLAPTIELISETIITSEDDTFTFTATIKDNDGLKSINLTNADIELDKTIDLSVRDSIYYTFDLEYKFSIPSRITGYEFPVILTATDFGNRVTQETIIVRIEDLKAPVFVSAPERESYVIYTEDDANADLSLEFEVSDNKELATVSVEITNSSGVVMFSDYIDDNFENDKKRLNYEETVSLDKVAATYTLTIVATDRAGNEATTSSTLIATELLDFDLMYLADVETAAELNSDAYGVPMLIDHTGEFEYTTRYYNEEAGTKIYFIQQKTAFAPLCFGLDPSDSSKLLRSSKSKVDPIVLTQIGYYEIVFNSKTCAYTMQTYTPTDTPVAVGSTVYLNDGEPAAGTMTLEMALIGDGLPGVGNWAPGDPYILTVSSTNPYQFTAEISFTKDATTNFTIGPKHPWGWWLEPSWRFSKTYGLEKNVAGPEDDSTNVPITIPTTGKYKFVFDTHLERSKLYLID